MDRPDDRPVKPPLSIPPPLVMLALLGVGLAIHFAFPARLLPKGWAQFVVGIPIASAGLAFGMTGNAIFNRVGTDDRFAKPTTVIVTDGPFSVVRNPMYIGLVTISLGIVLAVNAAWALIQLPALVAYLTLGPIKNEEAYLAERFGNEYLDYKGSVPRWVPRLGG